jgi:hypothetical protein
MKAAEQSKRPGFLPAFCCNEFYIVNVSAYFLNTPVFNGMPLLM